MKNRFSALIPAAIIATSLLSFEGNAQTRKLPDGTIIYSDGTRKLPNGTVIYKDGKGGNNGSTVSLPDGSVVLPDGSRQYPTTRRRTQSHTGKRLPPGQAKKVYGGSARDYAPGQQKKWKKNKEWKAEKHHGKGKHHDD